MIKQVLPYPMTEARGFSLSSWIASMISYGFTDQAGISSELNTFEREKLLSVL